MPLLFGVEHGVRPEEHGLQRLAGPEADQKKQKNFCFYKTGCPVRGTYLRKL